MTTESSSKIGRPPILTYVPLIAAAFIAGGALAGCDVFDSPDATYGGVCVDQRTQQRLPDDRCGDFDDRGIGSGVGSYWMWMPTDNDRYSVPSVGQRVDTKAGTRTVPAGTPISKGVPPKGGQSMKTVQRGGFGIKSGSTSGIGAKSSGGSAGS
ncbi:hypothetical protein [Amycolatopsis sp. DSM 110486]|uniref:hypothetical protein n=1 Tax=Amycolatopsis sp. DSM 110486 TaxID=2865832 RepID=UPI001C69D138|nr:hypothetical protein [Amycolatopsis sp. DSM 110486]QYN17534.1 hypothetical protein K1T34_32635 [Amycolatopsis sp. DSM 110486]